MSGLFKLVKLSYDTTAGAECMLNILILLLLLCKKQ